MQHTIAPINQSNMPSKSKDFIIQEAISQKDLSDISQLFWHYGESRGFDSVMGDFKNEILNLPGPYLRPHGCLLIGRFEGIPVGCVAYQKLSSEICEMKRLYVLPEYRGHGFGQKIVDRIISEAKKTT